MCLDNSHIADVIIGWLEDANHPKFCGKKVAGDCKEKAKNTVKEETI